MIERKMKKRTMVAALAGVLVLGLFGCSDSSTDGEPAGQVTPPETEPDLSLRIFDCGRIRVEDPSPFSLTADEVPTTEMFVPCYLIDHPDGQMIWDGGLSAALADQEGWVDQGGFELRLERTLQSQLSEIGVAPSEIDYVAFSHMHFDHVGQGDLFATTAVDDDASGDGGTRHLIQSAEYEAAFSGDFVELYPPEAIDPLRDLEHVRIDGDYDVFGDGRVMIVAAPGHTPGHQVLLVDLEETGPVVLSGDLYHFARSREERLVPVFNTDPEQTLASMEKVEGLLEVTGATLWIEHDLPQTEQLRLSPEVYR